MYKVLKNFTDKYTGVRYKAGDIVEFTEKRAKEILTVGNLIEKIEENALNLEKTVQNVQENEEECTKKVQKSSKKSKKK